MYGGGETNPMILGQGSEKSGLIKPVKKSKTVWALLRRLTTEVQMTLSGSLFVFKGPDKIST